MKDRLIQFMTAEKISAAQLADKIGVQRSNISHIIAGRNKPGFDFIEKMLVAFPHLNSEWLLLGKGSMYKVAQEQNLFSDEQIQQITKQPQSVETAEYANDISDTENDADDLSDDNFDNKKTDFIKPNLQQKKQIERIIICYTDKSFDIYNK